MTRGQGPWVVTEEGWDPAKANYHETIFTVGNGRLGSRGTLEERHTGAMPGTFLAGVYDAWDSPVIDLVNAPDWLATEIYVNGTRMDLESTRVVEHRRVLDLRTGRLERQTVLADQHGHRTRLATRRVASMADRDLCALRVEVTPLDHDATIVITTGLDANRRNLERLPLYPDGFTFDHRRKWDKWARSTHLQEIGRGFKGAAGYVGERTIGSGIDLTFAYRALPDSPPATVQRQERHQWVGESLTFTVPAGFTVGLDKIVGVATSRDPNQPDEPLKRALATVETWDALGFAGVAAASAKAWSDLWRDADCLIEGDERAALALRFSIYHLLIAANPEDPTVSIGAKSLSGEGYRGHVFWDSEIMILPFFLYTQPAAARALLAYRHHTLPGARELSAEYGTRGARFAWESADSGTEECPRFTPDGKDEFFARTEEVHVSADVVYGILQYHAVTGDEDFLLEMGAEVIFETSRFWLSRCEEDGQQLTLRVVMGPDEFHSHVDNNAFTNRLVVWQLSQAAELYQRMAADHREALDKLTQRIGLADSEADGWRTAAQRLKAPLDPEVGLIEQFDGYFDRLDVPVVEWDANDMPQYPPGRNHFNCEDTMLLKQADVLMLMFLLPDEYSQLTKRANYDFYEPRTLHKSSLSPSIHVIAGLQVGDHEHAERYFPRSAFVDLDDNQSNTEEGMHIASAAGTWQAVVHGFAGFRLSQGYFSFAPSLPESWSRLSFSLRRRGHRVVVSMDHIELRLELEGPLDAVETVLVEGMPFVLHPGEAIRVPLGPAAGATPKGESSAQSAGAPAPGICGGGPT